MTTTSKKDNVLLEQAYMSIYEAKDHSGKSCEEAHPSDPSPAGHKEWEEESEEELEEAKEPGDNLDDEWDVVGHVKKAEKTGQDPIDGSREASDAITKSMDDTTDRVEDATDKAEEEEEEKEEE
tara:strand:- start:1234 stop:1605 length:372 start_codon:yes stop_codon:yes gene_type:complete